MIEFFETNKPAIIYCGIVIILVAFLVLVTNIILNVLVKRFLIKHSNEEPTAIYLVKKIFKTLWIILGISAISFVFIKKDLYEEATKNFFLTFYIGFVLILTIVGASMVQTYFRKTIHKKTTQEEDATSHQFLRYLAIFMVYFLGALLMILAFPSLRGIAQTALGGAGVLAIVAGLASQEVLSNIVGGIFIIIFKPFKIHDVIKISNELIGTVTDITLRHTIVKNYENRMIVIPNNIINKEKVVNYDLGEKKCCQWVEIKVDDSTNLKRVKEIISEECNLHPSLLDNRTELEIANGNPKVLVRIISIDKAGIVIRAWAWAKDFPTSFAMKCDLLESIKTRFDEEGIRL